MTSKNKHMQNISIMWLYRTNVWNLVGNLQPYTSLFTATKHEWMADFLITPYDGTPLKLTKEQSFQYMKEGTFITLIKPQFLLDYNLSIPHIVKPTLTEYLFALKNKK